MKQIALFLAILLVLFSLNLVDSVLAADAFVAYRSTTGTGANYPKIRFWNSTGTGTYGSEVELVNSGSPLRQLVIKQSPVSSKLVLITYSNDGNFDAYTCIYNCTFASSWTFTSNFATRGAIAQRPYDFEFEQSTGDLIFVYSASNTSATGDIGYMVLPETSLSFSGLTTSFIDDTTSAADINFTWIALDKNPTNTSSEIVMVGFDITSSDITAFVWDGDAWGNVLSISAGATSTNNGEALAVKYAADSSTAMVVGGDGANGAFNWANWSGAWSAVTVQDSNGARAEDIRFMTLKADPATNDLQLVVEDSRVALHTGYWDGATWAMTSSIDTGIDNGARRVVDYSWLPEGSSGILLWDTDTIGNTLSMRTCSPQCSGATSTPSTYFGTGGWLTLWRNPTASDNVDVLGIRMNSTNALGSMYYDGTLTNYSATELTTNAGVVTYESYGLTFNTDWRGPSLNFIDPTFSSGNTTTNNYTYINVSSNEALSIAYLEWNGTNYTMNATRNNTIWYYNMTGLSDGTYYYKVYGTDFNNNTNVSETRNLTINLPPRISLVNPQDDAVNTSSNNITFYYNVTDPLDNISRCSLIIDTLIVLNTTGPINETITLNFTYTLSSGTHNWSIWCNDTYGLNSTSESRNITISLQPSILSILIDDFLTPENLTVLNAGSTKDVYCIVVVSDPLGPGNINYTRATFYYYLNTSGQPDNNNVHYTNASCSLNETTANNKTFNCGFSVYYHANNGTWHCNATSYNNLSNSASANKSTIINPLYAVNISDGITFGDVEPNSASAELVVNMTNLGNMPINISVLGYARIIGDNYSMNCSDNTNLSIGAVRYSNVTSSFLSKTSLTGTAQQLRLTMIKPTSTTPVLNYTYWQIMPDPYAGSASRYCEGYIIFSAESAQ